MAATDPEVDIRRLTRGDATAFRALRLASMVEAPEAFSSSYEEEAARPPAWFADVLAPEIADATFGAYVVTRLVGMGGFVASRRIKQRHKGDLVGVYVEPAWRGRGLARKLVGQVIAHASRHVSVLQASVTLSNVAARRLYADLGFIPYGIEPKALCVDGRLFDEELLALDLGVSPP